MTRDIVCPQCQGEGSSEMRLLDGDVRVEPCFVCAGRARIPDRRHGTTVYDVRLGVLGAILVALSGAVIGALLTLSLVSAHALTAPSSGLVPAAFPADRGPSGAPPQRDRVAPDGVVGVGNGLPDRRVSGGAPLPPAEIGTALTAGWATWFPCSRGWCDVAHVAMPGATYRTPRQGPDGFATVTIVLDGEVRSGVFPVVDECGCGDRHGVPTVVDLSLGALRELGLYDARFRDGIWRAEVSWSDGPRVTLPPTDTEEAR